MERLKKDSFLLLTVSIIAILSFSHLFHVGFVINDDIQSHLNASRLGFSEYVGNSIEVWSSQGRPNFLAYVFYFIPFAIDSFIYYKITSIVLILTNVLLLSGLVQIMFKNKWLTILTFIFSVIGLQNSFEHTPLTTFSGFFSVPISFLLISFILYICYLKNNKNMYLIASLISYTLTLYTYELFVIYILVFIALALYKERDLKQSIKRTMYHLLTLIIYATVYIIVSMNSTTLYEGSAVGNNIFSLDTLKVVWQFSVASIPTYFLWNEKYQYLFYLYSDLYLKEFSFPNIIESLKVEWVIKALMVFFVFTYCSLKIKVESGSKKFLVVIGFLVLMFFLPSLPLAITQHYQEGVNVNQLLGSPVTYFSYLTLVILIITIILMVLKKLSVHKWFKIIFIPLLGLLVSVVSIGVDFNNHYISSEQEKIAYKWKTVDKFLESEEYKNIPEHSFIVAPSLFNTQGSLGIHDSYWEQYFEYKASPTKDIALVNSIDKVPKEITEVFLIKYDQNEFTENQYILLAKANREGNFEYSSEIIMYNYTYYDSYTVIGQKNSSTAIEITGGKIFEAEELFAIPVMQGNFQNSDTLKKTILYGDKILVDSIIVNYNSDEFYQR